MNGESATWTRDTSWRQGHFLPSEAVNKLGFHCTEELQSTCVVVVSHDCDLVNDNLDIEPDVEVVVGRILEKANGNFSWAKSPRTLHLESLCNGKSMDIELVATAKCRISKSALASFSPDTTWSLPGASLSILRSWLAVRYNRASFPDEFVDTLKNSKVSEKLAKMIAPTHRLLSAIYFDVDGGSRVDHGDGSPYSLKIVLVYPPGEEPEESADQADQLAERIENLFAEKHFDKNTTTWSGVKLIDCISISEEDIPVSSARRLSEWHFEHMTLRDLD